MASTDVIEMTRQELYDRVWATPMRTLAREWGISDVGLAKICKRHHVPRPGLGHWAKKQHGKRVRKTPLPTIGEERLDKITLSVVDRIDGPDIADSEIAQLILKESEPAQIITVGERVQIRHPFIRSTKDSLKGVRPDDYGRVSPRRQFNGTHFDVRVSPKNVSRALRILQVLTTAMQARGHILEERSRRSTYACFKVLGEEFTVTIRESSKRSERDEYKSKSKRDYWSYSRRYDYTPTGILELCLNFDSYLSNATLRDTSKKPLENRLNEAIVSMLRIVDRRRTEAEHARIEAEAKAERRRIAIEEEIERRSDAVRIGKLQRLAQQWETHRRLSAFVETVRTEAESRHPAVDRKTEDWLTWADSFLRQSGPLCGGQQLPVYLLSHEDREKLRAECVADWLGYNETFRQREYDSTRHSEHCLTKKPR